MNLVFFLKEAVKEAAESLVKNLVARIKKTTIADDTLSIMVMATVTVLQGMGMKEEVRLLGLLVICHYGAKGREVPENISVLFTVIDKLAPVVASKPTVATVAVSAPAPANKSAPAQISASKPVSAPARTLETVPKNTPDEKKNKLISILSRFVLEGERIDGEKTRRLLDSVVSSTVEIGDEDAALVLRAAKKANDIGFHLIDRGSSDIFYCASVETIDNYVFGQDGEMIQVLAGLSEVKGEISPKLVARIFVLLVAIKSLKEKDALGQFEVSRVEALQAVVARIGYKKIEDELNHLLGGTKEVDLEEIHRKSQVGNNAFAGIGAVVAQLGIN